MKKGFCFFVSVVSEKNLEVKKKMEGSFSYFLAFHLEKLIKKLKSWGKAFLFIRMIAKKPRRYTVLNVNISFTKK